MNIKKALQTILVKSQQGADVTEDLQALIEAIELEEQIGKLTAKLEKTITQLEAGSPSRGRRRKSTQEPAKQAQNLVAEAMDRHEGLDENSSQTQGL